MRTDLSIFFKFCFLNTLFFIILHILHFRIFLPEIILKAAILDSIIAPLIPSIAAVYLIRNYYFIIFSSYLIITLCAILYSVLIPTMVDRSISVYMLIYLEEAQNNEINFDELRKKLQSNSILNQRFNEHNLEGTIEFKDDNVKLTKKGSMVAKIFLYNQKVLNLKTNY